MCGKDDKTTDGKQKRSSERKKLTVVSNSNEIARNLKIYFKKVTDRGNRTIVGKIAIVKQVVLASKK